MRWRALKERERDDESKREGERKREYSEVTVKFGKCHGVCDGVCQVTYMYIPCYIRVIPGILIAVIQ